MKIGIMQPYFFPYMGYFQLLNSVDTFVMLDDVNYIVRGYINRNYILLNGKTQRITLQLKKVSQNKLINEIEIANQETPVNLLKTIDMAYHKAPNFPRVFALVSGILLFEEANLSKYIVHSLTRLADVLGIKTRLVVSSSLAKDTGLKGQEKIIEICKRLGASEYINAPGGAGLYTAERFAKENIRLRFLQPGLRPYRQFDNGFVPRLSVLDALMFCSEEEISGQINDFTLS